MSVTSQRQIRVLHVDDEPDLADLTGSFLQREDDRFAIKTATSADEGLENITDCPPDCVVSDYNMPGMDGIEFLQAVREKYPDLPFILFTGKGSEAVASDAIAADVTDYLQKGSGSEKYELLANRIRNSVQARREAQRAERQEQLMRLTEFAGDTGGFELDRESNTIHLTAGTQRIIGRPDTFETSLEEAIELFHPDDREGIQQTLDRAIETGEELRDRWRLQPSDGDERFLDITITPVVENGEVTKLRGAGHDITDQKEREQELERQNELFAKSQNIANLGAWEHTPQEQETHFTDMVYEIYGVGPDYEPAPQKDIEEFYHPDDRDTVRTAIEEAHQSGKEFDIEVRITAADGTDKWVRTRGTPQVEDGTVQCIRGIFQDITERKEREQELQDLKRQYETLAKNFPNGAVYLIDTDLEPVRARGEELSKVGLSPGDVEGTKPHALFPEEIADELCHYYEEALDGNANTFEQEYRGERYRVQTVPVRTDSEEIEHLIAVSQNVTERREREQERERQYEAIFNQTYQFMGLIEPDGTVIKANKSSLEFGGLDPEDVIGEPLWKANWFQINDETQREVHEAVKRAANGEFVRYDVEIKGQGETVTIDFSIRPVTDKDGKVTYLIPEGRNISELESLQNRKQELEHQNKQLEEFASIVSHDLRNPLQVADGRLELIRQEYESDHIDGVAQALDRMDALIEDLLTLAREGEQVDETEPVGLTDVAKDSWQTVDTEQTALKADTSLVLKADQSRLRQLFENLYRNAVEHGGNDVTVSVGAMDGGFYVADTGPGIPESDCKEVFETGYSTNDEGTGFGLRIVKQIVDAHGWGITVTESEQGGARFEITGVERANR